MTALAERSEAAAHVRAVTEAPKGSQVLIVGDEPSVEQLAAALQEAGLVTKTVKSITEACEWAKSGHFQAVLSQPLLRDGSWHRLTDIANHYDLGFEVVLVARNFDLATWAEALNEGAFDVLDALSSRAQAAEVARSALWAAYLKGAGPAPAMTRGQQAA